MCKQHKLKHCSCEEPFTELKTQNPLIKDFEKKESVHIQLELFSDQIIKDLKKVYQH